VQSTLVSIQPTKTNCGQALEEEVQTDKEVPVLLPVSQDLGAHDDPAGSEEQGEPEGKLADVGRFFGSHSATGVPLLDELVDVPDQRAEVFA